ncbi:MAG TPA: SRPBCC family protein [Myxococcaceae bacterium]|nr:SRPBCC family protein [Myxococcaceae bacterium]
MPGATRSIVINAPMERVFSVIADYAKYPEFLPEVKSIRTSKRQGTDVDVHYEVEVLKRIRYTLRLREEPPNRISWTFVEGELMRDNRGQWMLETVGEGKTRATYNIQMKLGPLVPKSIVNVLVDSSLPKMLEAFKKRSESAA